ncbi:MAG: nucleotidyltransferase domain-containing protein [Thermaerobacter sp.]|nr:nucleotidyltransferase domain-containing protein [Thermaerobacter sp.]
MKFGLSDQTIRAIHDILHRHPEVDHAILYGSRAKGNYKTGSDIDLTLVGSKELTHKVLVRISRELEESSIPYIVDLSILDQIDDKDVQNHIQRRGIVFYQKWRTTQIFK